MAGKNTRGRRGAGGQFIKGGSATASRDTGETAGETAEIAGAAGEPGAGDSGGAAGAADTGAPAGDLGTVAVEVDREALLREADAVAAAAPSAPGVPGDASQDLAPQLPASERAAMAAPALRAFVHTGATIIAPNWNLTQAECAAIGDAGAEVMAHWMPDTDIPPKYMALFNLGVALIGVAWQRRDPETGAFRPLRAPPPKKAPEGTGAAPVAPAPGPAPLRL